MPFALIAALRAARRDRPEVLFSTSAPYGAHLVALLVGRLTGIPWVADFRDEWTANALLSDQPRALLALTERAEFAVCRRARRVVVAAGFYELLGLPSNSPRRVEILNGVDEADLPNPAPSPPEDRFVLANVGTIYGSIDPSPALRALAELAARGAIDRERVEVRLVGSIWEPSFEPPQDIRVAMTGYVEHRRAIAEMSAATALLLYVPSASLNIPGKLFEYLASGRPVLCLTHRDSLANRLVHEWRAGVVADPHDQREIEHAILTLWRRWLEDGLPDQEDVRRRTLEHYSRRANASRLAQVLDEARRG
jgi:glycosyltransferase involved in cell wall biosynthesis